MAEVIGSRLKDLLEFRNKTQSDVAGLIGVSQPSIGRLIDGSTRETGKLLELAKALQTSPDYLVGWSDQRDLADDATVSDKRMPFRSLPPEKNPDTVELDEIDVELGLGATYLDAPVKAVKVSFSRSWLRHFTDSSPENLFSATGIGDSMHPTIQDNDIVLVDRSQTTPRFGDKIYAVAYGQVGMVKRLRPMPDGGIKILSDNQSVPPETAYDDELHIIGRVVAIVRKV